MYVCAFVPQVVWQADQSMVTVGSAPLDSRRTEGLTVCPGGRPVSAVQISIGEHSWALARSSAANVNRVELQAANPLSREREQACGLRGAAGCFGAESENRPLRLCRVCCDCGSGHG